MRILTESEIIEQGIDVESLPELPRLFVPILWLLRLVDRRRG